MKSHSRRPSDALVEEGVIAGNYFNKYESRNPIVRRLMVGFHESIRDLVDASGAKDIHEVGCGEGHLTGFLARPGRRIRGSDFSPTVIEQARSAARKDGVAAEFQVCSVYDLESPRDAAELVVCCEVLEHLERPRDALRILATLARPYLVASVPREPLWRLLNMAGGRYWRDLGNTPGHLQHWSTNAFLALVGEFLEVVEVRRPLPWTAVLCRTRNDQR